LDRAIFEIGEEVEANLTRFCGLIPVLTSMPGFGELALASFLPRPAPI
jgi:hypothetical protein